MPPPLSFWQLIVLAVIQGITEFLPISSDGHLVVAAALMTGGRPEELEHLITVTIALHMGTLFSILVYYWRRICQLVGEDWRVLWLLALGTVPAVVVGVPLKYFAGGFLSDPLAAGCFLIVTGLLLLFAQRQPRGDQPFEKMTSMQALMIGVAQALAILPGLSRSGSTISTGMVLGLAPRSAATYSFLLAIPAIAGAGVLEAVDLVRGASSDQTPVAHLVIGAAVSFVVGLAAISGLVKLLDRGKLHYFAWWCIPLGIVVIAWQVALRWG